MAVPSEMLVPGVATLEASTDHYLRHVLRLRPGDSVELFDGTGRYVRAQLLPGPLRQVLIEDGPAFQAPATVALTVAVATPKGERADWLIEKLAELGVRRVEWLQCQRSVVISRGENRSLRWQRLAQAAARQSRCPTVTELAGPTSLANFIAGDKASLKYLAHPVATARKIAPEMKNKPDASLLVGPEGGFDPEELQVIRDAGYTPLNLSPYILRIETAAILGAAKLLWPLAETT